MKLSPKLVISLSQKLQRVFKKRRLMKGVSEVINGITSHRKIKMIFVAGTLDHIYERALQKAINDTNLKPKIYHLHRKYQNFVYQAIKDVPLDDKPRAHSRRFFKCRVFGF